MTKGGLEVLQLSWMTFQFCMQQGELVLPLKTIAGGGSQDAEDPNSGKSGWSQKENGKLLRQCYQKSFNHGC